MVYSSLYKTVEDNGLLAHIYEHLLAQYVMKYLQGRGFFISSDIVLTAKTYGDTCFIDAELYNPAAQKAYGEALRMFDEWDIPGDAALRAAGECGIEMNRVVAELKQDELLRSLNMVQLSAWRQQSDLTYRKADDKSSVNTFFRVPYIKYSRKFKSLFPEYVLEYSVDEKYIQSPVDQALAAVVMQVAALNFLVMIREKHTVYDRGDQWSEASKSVGYRMFLGLIKKDDNIVDQLKREFMEYVQFLSESSFCDNLQAALVRCSHNYEQVLLGRDTLNSILGGCVIGGKGWLEMADSARIQQMLAAIELDKVERQFNELKRRRDVIVARLIELEEITKKEAERTFRMGGAALLGARTGARECAATLMVDDMFAGGNFRGSTRYNEATGYLGAIKKEFGRQLLDDEESSE